MSRAYRHSRRVKPHWATYWFAGQRTCWLCLEPIDSPTSASIDHIIPRSYGGPDDQRYCSIAHKSCNNARGNSMAPNLMHRAFSMLGWSPQPLWEVCPDILAIAPSIPPDIAAQFS